MGILQPSDLPDTPDVDIRKYRSHGYPPERRSGPAPVPARMAKGKPWSPDEPNLEVMVEWMGTVDWDSIDNMEAIRMFGEKMCELDRIRPDLCEEFAAPNP